MDKFLKRKEYQGSPQKTVPNSPNSKTSIVWKFFKREGQDLVKCQVCSKEYSYKIGAPTSSLKRHCESKHKNKCEAFEKEKPKQIPIQKSFTPNNYPLQSEKRDHLNTLVIKHICQDLQPISVVEQKGFQNLVKGLDSKYILPNRKTVVKLLKKHHESVDKKVG